MSTKREMADPQPQSEEKRTRTLAVVHADAAPQVAEAEATPAPAPASASAAAPPSGSSTPALLMASIQYDDASAAIDFLERAFGFRRGAVHMSGERVIFAELHFGNSVLMVSGRKPDEQHFVSPKATGSYTGSIYVAVDDPDAHYQVAKAAGAEITAELEDKFYGSRDYSAMDPLEGYRFSFGTYKPPAETPGDDSQRPGSVCPCIAYDDAIGAIEFLQQAFGFRKGQVHMDGDKVVHAELYAGESVLMLTSSAGDFVSPKSLGKSTLAIVLSVQDISAHFTTAQSAGANILTPLASDATIGKEYSAKDSEGHTWYVGTYVPAPI